MSNNITTTTTTTTPPPPPTDGQTQFLSMISSFYHIYNSNQKSNPRVIGGGVGFESVASSRYTYAEVGVIGEGDYGIREQ